jgi:hypothetical protein
LNTFLNREKSIQGPTGPKGDPGPAGGPTGEQGLKEKEDLLVDQLEKLDQWVLLAALTLEVFKVFKG